MSSLEDGRFLRGAGKAAGFRPDDRASRSRPAGSPRSPGSSGRLTSRHRPGCSPARRERATTQSPGLAVTPAERVEIAGRVYRAILDEAVDRYLASSRAGAGRPADGAIFDALLAERLGDWSDLWRQAEDDAVMARMHGPSAAGGPAVPGRGQVARRADECAGERPFLARRPQPRGPPGGRGRRYDPAPRVRRDRPVLPDRGREPTAGGVEAQGHGRDGLQPGCGRGPDLPGYPGRGGTPVP